MNYEAAIDEVHRKLIKALVMCHKPARILEFGYGMGAVTSAIIDAVAFNEMTADYTIVDNWVDFGGKMPWTAKLVLNKVKFCEEDESNFVRSTKETYDFIVCDADHQKTHENWKLIFVNLLAEGGIVVFHDVCNDAFPNLRMIVGECMAAGCRYVLFNKNSKPDERCERGLLVIFK